MIQSAGLLSAWLLLPHLVSAAAFLAAMVWMNAVGTNRSHTDLTLGLIGYGSGGLALIASFGALGLHPWRTATTRQTLWLVVHLPALFIVLALGFYWLALHIA